MGDPKRITNKFSKPNHPWQKARIDKERELSKTYGLVNKRELWKMGSTLKGYKNRTKELTKRSGEQAQKEKQELITVMKKYGLLQEDNMDLILGLEIEAIMERRLQSVLKNKGLARTAKQARQMITHGHILVSDKKITAPSYLVSVEEEKNISFATKSPFISEEHPERAIDLKEDEKDLKKQIKKEVAIPIDPEEAKEDFVKDSNEETLVESLTETEKEALEQAKEAAHPEKETKAEEIKEAIEKKEEVAEGKPAKEDEAVEDTEETPGDIPDKAATPAATVKENDE